MNNLNSTLIEGVLEKAPEYRVTSKGTAVATFTVISKRYYVNRSGENFDVDDVEGLSAEAQEDAANHRNSNVRKAEGIMEETNYFDIETWGKLAEAVRDNGKKGRGCRVVGRLREDRWTARDGEKRSTIIVVAEHVEFRPEFKKTSTKKKG